MRVIDHVQCFDGDGVDHAGPFVFIPDGHLNNYKVVAHCAYIMDSRKRIDMGDCHELTFTTGRPNRLIRQTVNQFLSRMRDGNGPITVTIDGWAVEPIRLPVMALCDWEFDGRSAMPLWTRLYLGHFLTHQRHGISVCVDRGVPPLLDTRPR